MSHAKRIHGTIAPALAYTTALSSGIRYSGVVISLDCDTKTAMRIIDRYVVGLRLLRSKIEPRHRIHAAYRFDIFHRGLGENPFGCTCVCVCVALVSWENARGYRPFGSGYYKFLILMGPGSHVFCTTSRQTQDTAQRTAIEQWNRVGVVVVSGMCFGDY